MKIFNRQDFLALPAGVLYCAGRPWVFSELSVKGDTWAYGSGDFLYLDLQSIEAEGSGEQEERMDAMLREGRSFPMSSSYGRDGSFDDKIVYLVYEPDDIERLMEICQVAKACNLNPRR